VRVESPVKRLQTTVGELVVAAMDAALEVSKNQRRAYRLAEVVLNKMLSDSRIKAHRFKGNLSKRPPFH
jgi:hypothetical protein